MTRNAAPHSAVIGGTRGHGRAWVKLLAAKGHSVSVFGLRPPGEADRGLPGVTFESVDLSRPKAADRIARRIAARGKLDSLAFFQRYRGAGDSWANELSVSLSSTKSVIERLSGRFADDGSRSIVVVGSAATTFIANEQPPGYHVAKAGLLQLVRYYAAVHGPKGLRVNMVSPGAMIKEESQAFYDSQKSLRALYDRVIPLGRMGSSKDVSGAIEFLCSRQSAFITGQNIVVDGGLSLLWQESLARAVSPLAKQRVTRG